MKLIAICDATCRPLWKGGDGVTLGPSAVGVVLRSEDWKVVARIGRVIGVQPNNNAAEMYAAVIAIIEAHRLGATHLVVGTDSTCVAARLRHRNFTVSGRSFASEELRDAHRGMIIEVLDCPRAWVGEAHRLAASAIADDVVLKPQGENMRCTLGELVAYRLAASGSR